MSKISDLVFVRDKHVCPWWCCFTFDNIFRKLIHNPYKILSPYIKEGDTILDVGSGMGILQFLWRRWQVRKAG